MRRASKLATSILLALALFAGSAFAQDLAAQCRQDALAAHNELRRQHGAPDLEIDEALEARELVWITQQLAPSCSLSHSPGGGENLYQWSPSPANPCADAVKSWYSEINNWNFNSARSQGGVTGHFTQVVWRRATKLGCAAVMCPGGGVVVGCAYDDGNSGNFKDNVLPLGTPVTPLENKKRVKDDAACGVWFKTETCMPGFTNSGTGELVLDFCPNMCAPVLAAKRQAWLDAAAKLPAPANNPSTTTTTDANGNPNNGDTTFTNGPSFSNNPVDTNTFTNTNSDGSWFWSSSWSSSSNKKRMARKLM